jgi:cytochrome c oxidase subunit II
MRLSKWGAIPLLVVMSLLLLAGCGAGEPDRSVLQPAGPVAEMQLSLIQLSLGIMIIVLLIVFGIFFYVLFKYREKPGDDHIPEQVHGSVVLESIWVAVPIILLIILAVPTVATTFELAERFPDSEEELEEMEEQADGQENNVLRVNVTAHQYWWEFEYPDHGIVTAQDLYIPTDHRVYFELTASDVIHSFWIPSLGGKVDTIPGENNVNHLWLQADEPGVYQGKCAELCGASHALMDFKAVAVEPDEFEEWVETMNGIGGEEVAVSESAQQGQEVFEQNCLACHAVDGETLSQGPQGPNLAGYADRDGGHDRAGGAGQREVEGVRRGPADLRR